MSGKDDQKPEGSKPGEQKGVLKVEEFEIVELEDRLELADRCNKNCSCPGGS